MIYDNDLTFNVTVPASGSAFSLTSTPYLIANGTSGVPGILGDGNPISFEFEVTTAFTIGIGVPLAWLAIVVAANAALTSKPTILGMAQMYAAHLTTRIVSGMSYEDLVLGAKYVVRPAPFSRDQLTPGSPSTVNISQTDHLYLGAAIFVPNYDEDTATASFATGAVRARGFIDAPTQRSSHDRIYPTGMRVK